MSQELRVKNNRLESANPLNHLEVFPYLEVDREKWELILDGISKTSIITLPLFWNEIEINPGTFDLSGWKSREGDIISLLRLLRNKKLLAFILIYPYFPNWMLNEPADAIENKCGCGHLFSGSNNRKENQNLLVPVIGHEIFFQYWSKFIEKLSHNLRDFKGNTWSGTGFAEIWNPYFRDIHKKYTCDHSNLNQTNFRIFLERRYHNNIAELNAHCHLSLQSFLDLKAPAANSPAPLRWLYLRFWTENYRLFSQGILNSLENAKMPQPFFSVSRFLKSRAAPEPVKNFLIYDPLPHQENNEAVFWNHIYSLFGIKGLAFQTFKSANAVSTMLGSLALGLSGQLHVINPQDFIEPQMANNGLKSRYQKNYAERSLLKKKIETKFSLIERELANSLPIYSAVGLWILNREQSALETLSLSKNSILNHPIAEQLNSNLRILLGMAGLPAQDITEADILAKKYPDKLLLISSNGPLAGEASSNLMDFIHPEKKNILGENLDRYLKKNGRLIFIPQTMLGKNSSSKSLASEFKFEIPLKKAKIISFRTRLNILFLKIQFFFILYKGKKRLPSSSFFSFWQDNPLGRNRALLQFIQRRMNQKWFILEKGENIPDKNSAQSAPQNKLEKELHQLLIGLGEISRLTPSQVKHYREKIREFMKDLNILPIFQTDLNLMVIPRRYPATGKIKKVFLILYNPYEAQIGSFSMDRNQFIEAREFQGSKILSSLETPDRQYNHESYEPIEVPVAVKSHALTISVRMGKNEAALYRIALADD